MSGGQLMNMDLALQIAQIKGFEGLVDATFANNNQLMVIADTALTANRGSMSTAFQSWVEDVHRTCTMNNQHLQGIAEGLHFGLGATEDTDASGASMISSLIGQVSSPAMSGSHFN